MNHARYEINGELTILLTPEVQLDDPPRMLEQSRFALLQHFLRFLYPPLGLNLGIFVELKYHQGREHSLMVLIEILILAHIGQCLE